MTSWSHAPAGYVCPFCRLLRGVDTEINCAGDIVYRDEQTTALIAPKWWPANHGHVLVIPNVHVENIYAIDDKLHGAVAATTRRIAIALKEAYRCDGVSTRQHNEPAGNQDVWHFTCTFSRAIRRPSLRASRGDEVDDPGRARAVRREAASGPRGHARHASSRSDIS